MTLAEQQAAVAALRALGWTCVEPATDTLPALAIGQIWVAADGKKQRKITDLEQTPGGRVLAVVASSKRIYIQSWNAWVRLHQARPVAQGSTSPAVKAAQDE